MDKTKYSISVIIPTHNRLSLLERALNSVMHQSYRPLEIIVVDDGSTDGTSDALKKNYPQINLLTQTHQGVSAARNYGIREAQGNWIALLDSDDAWQPDKLKKQTQALLENPEIYLCHTDEIWIRNGRRVNSKKKHKKTGGWIFQECLPLCCISPSSALISKKIFTEIGNFDESLPACEDYDFWLRFCSNYPVLFIEEPLVIKYGGHQDQLSRTVWGLDRFRIQSLEKILKSDHLDTNNRKMALETQISKIKIYLNGARKRNKNNEIKTYEEKLNYWNLVKEEVSI